MTDSPRKARFGFTKLIVDDEEAMATYYAEVYGLNKLQRVTAGDKAIMGPLREVIMGPGDAVGAESLVIVKFLDRPAPRDREVILGFVTDDLDALMDRVVAQGGQLLGPARSMPEHGVRVQFTTDPEGRVSENVEMIAR